MRDPVICIDGPAASGKTTVAKALAERLGFLYLDTGVLYRALTWVALRRGISPSDEERLAELARSIDIEVKPAPPGDSRQTIVIADGEDVSLAIRTLEVDANVSEVSAHRAVRAALVDLQRSFAEKGGVVLAGRDMGTVIWPEAEVKLFLDASQEERAMRRKLQAAEQGTESDLQSVLAELRRRDQYDSSRAVAPLKPAEDAVILDTTPLTVEQVVDRVLGLLQSRADRSERGAGAS
jgi:cytidylate kinase